MTHASKDDYSVEEYLKNIIKDKLETFYSLVKWSEEAKIEYNSLLNELKSPYTKGVHTTKAKGDRLENLVKFIFEHSFFFDLYANVKTDTNEIDELIVLSQRGKQALHTFGLTRELLCIDDDMFIGECKNYKDNLNVTYVGKFYSLMMATDIAFGIIFTQEGLTGSREGYKDAYGLTKVLRLIEKYKYNRELYIIDFTLEDYEQIKDGKDFYKMIETKKNNLRTAANYDKLLKENVHENADDLKKIIENYV